MRILIIGDQHFRYELPYGNAIKDGRRAEWEAVKNLIHDTAKGVDAIVLMGDNFNARHNNSSVINEFIEFLKKFGKKEVYIMSGNHERYGMFTALDFLKKVDMPNWHIYTEVASNIRIGDKTATFIPYTTPAMLGVLDSQEGSNKILEGLPKNDYAFVHHAITGTETSEFFSEITLDKPKMEELFKKTFGGHVHKSEKLSDQVYVVGNIFTHDMGEQDKYIFVSDNDVVEQIKLPVRGLYKIFWNDPNIDLEDIPANSIVKCIVTDRSVNIQDVRKALGRFDAHIIVEQYPNEREKVHFESGAMDLSTEGLLKMYSEAKAVSYEDLKDGFELIK